MNPQVEFVVLSVSGNPRSGVPETTDKTCEETNTSQVEFVVL
jgi:hypothetical protein